MNKPYDKKVHIMLATYNGQEYLREQLESIIAQTYLNTVTYISDDHSTDNTLTIIEEYTSLYPNKIILLPKSSEKMGAKKNFAYLFQMVEEADYYMFCDQDDVWMYDKIQCMVEESNKHEENNKYVLIYHDLTVVDENLDMISPSFISYSGLKLRKTKVFSQCLTYNCIPGCTMMFNHNLKKLTSVIPDACIMHDWWLTLVAIGFQGKILYINKQLLKYRQHSINELGAFKSQNILGYISSFINLKNFSTYKKNNDNMKKERYKQAEYFLLNYQTKLTDEYKFITQKYLEVMVKESRIINFSKAYMNGFVFWNLLYTIKFYFI